MNDRFITLSHKLLKELDIRTLDFLDENLSEKENLVDVMNLIMVSYLNSMLYWLDNISSKNKELNKDILGFIKSLESFLSTHPLMSKKTTGH